MSKRSVLLLVLGLFTAALGGIFLAGCATHGPAARPAPEDDMTEFRRLTSEARQAIDQVMAVLDEVSRPAATCPPALLEKFQQEVGDLEVESVGVRSHARAILNRGDEYFKTWERLTTETREADSAAVNEEQQRAMLETFHRLKTLSDQTTGAFRPFLSGLREVQSALERDPASVAAAPTRTLMASTRAQGIAVQKNLAAIQSEVDALTALRQSARPPGKK